MSQNALSQITALLATRGYVVTETGPGTLRIQETDSGISLQAVLEGEILFFSMVCATVPTSKLTPEVMHRMLDSNNGISTSHFQLFTNGKSSVISLNNFCKLQEMGADDEDDILSCVSFLLADVLHARNLLAADLA
ncbi:MAG TPA: hypothetical protein VNH18_13655 [Bryobacteraceae bacterium]|nr:hypothetical protein [Bryobacteraceae bacterium]